MGGQGNPRERNREGGEREGGMGEGRERRLGEKKFKKTIGRKSLLPAVAASTRMGIGRSRNMSIFATVDKLYPPNDWLVGSSLPPKFSPTIIESTLNELTPNNVSYGTLRRISPKYASLKVPNMVYSTGNDLTRKQSTRTQLIQREVPPLDVPELLAYLVRQSGPFLDQIGVRRG
ncbi:unnamed protein product [Camellia sinensis]